MILILSLSLAMTWNFSTHDELCMMSMDSKLSPMSTCPGSFIESTKLVWRV